MFWLNRSQERNQASSVSVVEYSFNDLDISVASFLVAPRLLHMRPRTTGQNLSCFQH